MTRDIKAEAIRNGEHKDLHGKLLPDTDLHDAFLSYADLSYTDLSYADLSGADLSGADLSYAVLTEADLSGADLSGADLSDAFLTDADLSGADLSDAFLPEADLSGADLSDANLESAGFVRATLDDAILPEIHPPEDGDFVAWKAASGAIVNLWIPPDARRTSGLGSNKCRADRAVVLEVLDADGTQTGETAASGLFDPQFEYREGETVTPSGYSEDRRYVCSKGIHFFMEKEEAIDWLSRG